MAIKSGCVLGRWIILCTFTYVLGAYPHHQYCIIGAGPSGLQLGYFLHRANRDYVIYERSNTAGHFFTKYPRHRKLISINKVHTGSTNKEFNFRHDWNSLISDDESMLFRHFSKEFFPPADTMVKYLQEYAKKFNLSIEYNKEIKDIKPIINSDGSTEMFYLKDQHSNMLSCSVIIVATGLWKPNVPPIGGVELAENYEEISTNPDDFEGKSVLILGRGNSAFETADSIYGKTNFIHMVARHRIRLAWETHYVGDLRAVNNGLLDTYQLKSLDGLLEYDISSYEIKKEGNKLILREKDTDDNNFDDYDNDPLLTPYDKIILCLGFTFDKSIFQNESDIRMCTGKARKYPMIDNDYRSPTIDGLYFAGTITHSLDYRMSAGGFIHGFRYTARTLSRILSWRYHREEWPSQTFPVSQISNVIIKRVNEASGIYQMFSVLADVILFQRNSRNFAYYEEYPVELIHKFSDMTGGDTTNTTALVIVLQYGEGFHWPTEDVFREDRAATSPKYAYLSNFLHPVLYFYDKFPDDEAMERRGKERLLPKPVRLHHMLEDFNTNWSRPNSHIKPLKNFLNECLDSALERHSEDECLIQKLTKVKSNLDCRNYFNTNMFK